MSFSADLKKQLFIKAQNLVPQHQLSRVIGKVAASENVLVKTAVIQAFKAKYGIDMSIAEQTNPNQYKSFNEFFTRALKEGVRGVDERADSIVCPADGAISQLGKIEAGDIFQAKGQSFSVEKLIGDPQLAKPFVDGQFATVYLSPKDYHRVHMPFAGTLTETL
ncbi:MAG TPA: phosphatidylserine decarboxylase, partial [Acinetobacter junii]|nr:phosphatidylserine decarboxylase [Acinetobacter junii]